MGKNSPFISFVISGRNDNYCGNFIERLQIFLDSLIALWQKYKLDAELIIVEWNALQDRPLLQDVIIWPKEFSYGSVRIIKVPCAIHSQISNSDKIPFFVAIASNIGIRRAKGKYVTITTPDIIFSDSLIKFISKGRLSENCFYRVNRYDVDIQNMSSDNIWELEKICKSHWLRVHSRFGTFSRKDYLKFKIKRFLRPFIHPRGAWHDIRIAILAKFQPWLRFNRLHARATGDFLLMPREAWYRFKGYPEILTNRHIDSYLCFLVGVALKQVILPYPIYHQDHPQTNDYQQPLLCLDFFIPKMQQALIRKEYKADEFTPNLEDWGKSNEVLLEYEIPAGTYSAG